MCSEAQDLLKRTEATLTDSDRRNLILEEENKRLRTQYKSQENDREFVVRQLVAVKRDNVRLREEIQKANSTRRLGSAITDYTASQRPGTADSAGSGSRPGSGISRPGTAGGGGSIDRYRETVRPAAPPPPPQYTHTGFFAAPWPAPWNPSSPWRPTAPVRAGNAAEEAAGPRAGDAAPSTRRVRDADAGADRARGPALRLRARRPARCAFHAEP
jgi:hypothetical protein